MNKTLSVSSKASRRYEPIAHFHFPQGLTKWATWQTPLSTRLSTLRNFVSIIGAAISVLKKLMRKSAPVSVLRLAGAVALLGSIGPSIVTSGVFFADTNGVHQCPIKPLTQDAIENLRIKLLTSGYAKTRKRP